MILALNLNLDVYIESAFGVLESNSKHIWRNVEQCGEMVDFGKSVKIIKISGKRDKLNTYNGFSRKYFFLY